MFTLVILAAGAGSRYGGLKQLAPIGPSGETLLEYSVYDALRAGFSRVVLVVRPEDQPAFDRRLAKRMARRVPLAYVRQTTGALPPGFGRRSDRIKPWGTAHAVLAAEAEITGAFAVVNADDFYGAGSFDVLSSFLRAQQAGAQGGSPATLAVVGFEVAQTLTEAGPVSRALCRLDDQGLLRQIVELKKVWRQGGRIRYGDDVSFVPLRGDELVSMNMWGFPRDLFAELRCRFGEFHATSNGRTDGEFLLPDVVQALIRDQRFRVQVLRGSGPWCGITFREDEQRTASVIASLVAQGEYPEELWA